MTYIIEFNREGCIGAAACQATNPKFWKLDNTAKANLKDAKQNKDNSIQTREITREEFKSNMDAAMSCPVNVIHIKKKETGEKLI